MTTYTYTAIWTQKEYYDVQTLLDVSQSDASNINVASTIEWLRAWIYKFWAQTWLVKIFMFQVLLFSHGKLGIIIVTVFFKRRCLYLKAELQSERWRETEISHPLHLSTTGHNSQGWDNPKPGTGKVFQVGQALGSSSAAFPGLLSKKLDQKWSSQGLNCCPCGMTVDLLSHSMSPGIATFSFLFGGRGAVWHYVQWQSAVSTQLVWAEIIGSVKYVQPKPQGHE